MAKVTVKANCKCGFDTKITIRKPDRFTPSVGVFNCDGCESKIQYHIKKESGVKVIITTKYIEMTPTLIQLAQEKEAENG